MHICSQRRQKVEKKKGNKVHHVEIKPERKAHSHNYISTIKKKKEMETTNGKLAFRLFY